jgi:hypothetical protein
MMPSDCAVMGTPEISVICGTSPSTAISAANSAI